jgi:hypothetical protein
LVEQGTLLYRPRPDARLETSNGTAEYDSSQMEPAVIIPYLPTR